MPEVVSDVCGFDIAHSRFSHCIRSPSVAKDYAINQTLAVRILERTGNQATLVSIGQDAIDKLSATTLDPCRRTFRCLRPPPGTLLTGVPRTSRAVITLIC